MKVQFLVSTMNRENFNFLYEIFPGKLIENINAVVINQCTKIKYKEPIIKFTNNITIYSLYDIGLSKSRNLALQKAEADICIITDDDYIYNYNVVDIVRNAYIAIPYADIITFQSLSKETLSPRKKYKNKIFKHKSYQLSSISSSEVTFRLKSIKKHNIFFDESFGLGTNNLCGEEGIFLMDCYKKGLNIFHYPSFLVTEPSYTTGFKIVKRPDIRGKIYKRMFRNKLLLYLIFIYTSLVKYKDYREDYSILNYFLKLLKSK